MCFALNSNYNFHNLSGRNVEAGVCQSKQRLLVVNWWTLRCGCFTCSSHMHPLDDKTGRMQLGMDGVFVGSGIFKSGDAAKRARAIVQVLFHFRNAITVVLLEQFLYCSLCTDAVVTGPLTAGLMLRCCNVRS